MHVRNWFRPSPFFRSVTQTGRTGPKRSPRRRLVLETLEDRTVPATLTVTGVGDAIAEDGVVTLREAIVSANNNAAVNPDVVGVGAYGFDTIAFAIPGNGVHTISPLSQLP